MDETVGKKMDEIADFLWDHMDEIVDLAFEKVWNIGSVRADLDLKTLNVNIRPYVGNSYENRASVKNSVCLLKYQLTKRSHTDFDASGNDGPNGSARKDQWNDQKDAVFESIWDKILKTIDSDILWKKIEKKLRRLYKE